MVHGLLQQVKSTQPPTKQHFMYITFIQSKYSLGNKLSVCKNMYIRNLMIVSTKVAVNKIKKCFYFFCTYTTICLFPLMTGMVVCKVKC